MLTISGSVQAFYFSFSNSPSMANYNLCDFSHTSLVKLIEIGPVGWLVTESIYSIDLTLERTGFMAVS